MTALKSLLFFILAPGMVAGYIPLALFRQGPQIDTGISAYLALPLWLAGGTLLIWSFWNFVHEGRGTPAPIDPPKIGWQAVLGTVLAIACVGIPFLA